MRLKIMLDSIPKVNEFEKLTRTFESDIYLSQGRYVVNGKSIMGIFSLDLMGEIEASIETNNEIEEKMFGATFSKFVNY